MRFFNTLVKTLCHNTLFDIIVDVLELDLPMHLRGKGYGVTSWTAEGKDGERLCLKVLAKRKNETKLRSFVTQLSPKAFIISYEPNRYNGGFLMGSFESIIQINNKV